MSGLLLALALASPSFAGVVAIDGGATTHTEGRAPTSTGSRVGARLGFSMRKYGLDCIYELQAGWVRFPTDAGGLSASGFDAGSGVRLGVELFDLRPEIFAHLGVEGLFRTQVDVRDDQRGRSRTVTTREEAGLGADVGLGLTYIGLPGLGVGVHGMWQTTLEIGGGRQRLSAGLHVELRL